MNHMKQEIFSYMLDTRGEKYKWFLRALRSFKYISMSPTRGDFLEAYYTLMRYIDDIVDGDAPLPEGFQSAVEFVEEKIDFAKHSANPKDSADYLMLYCFELADKFGQEFSSETQDILQSMLFDARRFGKRIIFSEKELLHHFYLLDIRGTVRAALKVFGEDSAKYSLLEPLGLACRIFYNLRDYEDDIKAGLINISAEDFQRFGISDLENRLSSGVQAWFRAQAIKGLELLQEHRKIVPAGDFRLLTRITFPVLYEHSARRYFKKVLL